MKKQTLLTTSLLAAALMAGTCQAGSGRDRTFGFAGEVDAFDRSSGTMVVDDLMFRFDEQTLVHRNPGHKGTLSDLSPGTKIGFYPESGPGSTLNEIWILPRNWQGKRGFAK